MQKAIYSLLLFLLIFACHKRVVQPKKQQENPALQVKNLHHFSLQEIYHQQLDLQEKSFITPNINWSQEKENDGFDYAPLNIQKEFLNYSFLINHSEKEIIFYYSLLQDGEDEAIFVHNLAGRLVSIIQIQADKSIKVLQLETEYFTFEEMMSLEVLTEDWKSLIQKNIDEKIFEKYEIEAVTFYPPPTVDPWAGFIPMPTFGIPGDVIWAINQINYQNYLQQQALLPVKGDPIKNPEICPTKAASRSRAIFWH